MIFLPTKVAFTIGMLAVDDSVAERPAPVEASALPVSNKPVTLNFKGSAANKSASTIARKHVSRLEIVLYLNHSYA